MDAARSRATGIHPTLRRANSTVAVAIYARLVGRHGKSTVLDIADRVSGGGP
ncbi:hypothetical protein FraEuI1c_5655 [Pseudofrankia inefficax]|uniref:Uncharacterized protein n=1 Tax=Pseudofrankia inefficax (strain DSM 45817 / CECT 9037 / DDB 130130 / EuI1c) TaxID=298654 RepID=E3IUF4_PSEI1|nr:hypothetical protein FraEuI1c_5655 [Pseudofrankia inefficax]